MWIPESLVAQQRARWPQPFLEVSNNKGTQDCSGSLGSLPAGAPPPFPLCPKGAEQPQASPAHALVRPPVLPVRAPLRRVSREHSAISLLTGQWLRLPSAPQAHRGRLEPSPNSCKWRAICTHSQDESLCFNCLSFFWHCYCHYHGCLLCLLAVCWQDILPDPANHQEERYKKEEGKGHLQQEQVNGQQ